MEIFFFSTLNSPQSLNYYSVVVADSGAHDTRLNNFTIFRAPYFDRHRTVELQISNDKKKCYLYTYKYIFITLHIHIIL